MPQTPGQAVLRLLADHASVLEALVRRNRATFDADPVLAGDRDEALLATFNVDVEVPSSLITVLAPLVFERVLRLAPRLRRRLARARREMPLEALRELDSTCLRQNARRPGHSLVEKAGPRGTLRGVVRVERFDTVENRVVVAGCRRLLAEASQLLSELSPATRRTRRATDLKKLAHACKALLARPELQGISPPRPGDRPSNALLHDANYRAVWRAWRLLRGAEERFSNEWAAMDQVLEELLLASTWTLFSGMSFEVPRTVRILDKRPVTGRIVCDERRWFEFDPEQVRQWTVRRAPSGLTLKHEAWSRTGIASPRTWHLSARFNFDAPGNEASQALLEVREEGDASPLRRQCVADRKLATELAALLTPLPLPPSPGGPAAPAPSSVRRMGLSLLGRRIVVADHQGVSLKECAAAVRVAAGPGSHALLATGDEAALSDEAPLLGPTSLCGIEAELGGALAATHVPPGAEVAVVIPDGMDEAQQAHFRTGLGESWLVPHTVAVALGYAAQFPEDFQAAPPGRVAVVAVSAGSVDLAVLHCRHEAGQVAWVREQPGDSRLPSPEARLTQGSPTALGDWLRAESASAGWHRGPEGGWAWREFGTSTVDAKEVVLHPDLARAGYDTLLVSGDDALAGALSQLLPTVRVVALAETAAAVGARTFLERHAAGLPTWVERLPHLAMEVRRDGARGWDDIILPGTEILPGQSGTYQSRQLLTIRPGEKSLDFRLSRNGRASAYCFHIEGSPLPVSAPVTCTLVLEVRFGKESFKGALVPSQAAPFPRLLLQFKPQSAEDQDGGATLFVPTYRPPPPISDGAWEEIQRSAQALQKIWLGARDAERNEARRKPATTDALLEQPVSALSVALKAISGTGPESLSESQRRFIERDIVPQLDWLLGAGGAPERRFGTSPALSRGLGGALRVARQRARLHSQGFHAFALKKLKTEEKERGEWMAAIGATVDGMDGEGWTRIERFEPRTDEERRLFGRAVFHALCGHPGLVPALSGDRVSRLLQRLLQELGSLEPTARRRDAFTVLFRCVPHLCRSRSAGHLRLEDVREQRRTLHALRERLPMEVRRHGAGAEGDEPAALACDALDGQAVMLPNVMEGT